MKTCNKCEEEKELTAFNKNPKGKFGVRSNCKECQKIITNSWYENNKARKLQKAAQWKKDNPKKIKKYSRNSYMKERRKTDVIFKLRCVIRERLTKIVRNKSKSSLSYLGCSVGELREYLESKFQPGMTWENYGRTGWHIDHIKPLAAFDLLRSEELRAACHYTNLQPLWASDNLRKGARSMIK